jgi:peptidoglycan/xylan/chitin deacetylase (PgdA/CDA1 family)
MHRGGCKTGHGGIFECINYNDGYSDLITSKNIVGSSKVFAYPFGDYNDSTIKLLQDTGYNMAVTTVYGKVKVGDYKYTLPRVRIQGTYSLNSFINAIK